MTFTKNTIWVNKNAELYIEELIGSTPFKRDDNKLEVMPIHSRIAIDFRSPRSTSWLTPERHPKESLSRLGIRTPYMSENSISMHLSFIRLMSNSSKVQLKHKLLLRGARIK